jgi:hypothetical protein
MRERRIGLAVIAMLLLVLGTRYAPHVALSADLDLDSAADSGIEVRAAVDFGTKAGALLFTWTIDHLERR